METAQLKSMAFHGESGKLAENIIDKWLVGLRETNPAILDMFRDRDLKPYRSLLPWSGEFAGKYITGAYYIHKMTGSRELFDYIESFLDELFSYQDEDGYLGCFSEECRMTGAFSQSPEKIGETWDSWSHYHILYGILCWYSETKRDDYLAVVEKIASFYINHFYNGKQTLVSIGSSEMNLAVLHAFALLYNLTKKPEYLAFAKNVMEDLSDEAAGNYLYYALSGYEFYQCRKPRWESMHIILGIAEMHRATGDRTYLQAADQIVKSILKTDIHNTGAFSTEEQAIGHPYKNGNIETCCVVAFNALAFDVFRLTEEPALLDFLERSHYNAVLGYYSPTGKWSTYHTPMDGNKCANFHSIGFQCRPGSPELNCCSVNAPRGVALISQWALMENRGALHINSYEAFSAVTANDIAVKVTGDYPCGNTVKILLDTNGREKDIKLRIPGWSLKTVVEAKGKIFSPPAGGICRLDGCIWNDETISIRFDFSLRLEHGERDYEGKTSIYKGPVLYAWDNVDNPDFDFENLPALAKEELEKARPERQKDRSIKLALKNGAVLTDFYHAGVSGSEYKTWLAVEQKK